MVKPFSKVNNSSFDGNVNISWFEDGKLNVSYNCLDRHLEILGDKTAIIWESDDPNFPERFHIRSYMQKCVNFLMG